MMASPAQTAFLPLAALMFATGIGIPIFAALNSALATQLGSPFAATAVTFAVGLVMALALVVLTGFPPREAMHMHQPLIWFGAVFMLFYGAAISFAAPKIGVGNAVFFVLLGQLVAAAAIDHFALLGAMKASLTAKRALGIAVMALGVYLARKPV